MDEARKLVYNTAMNRRLLFLGFSFFYFIEASLVTVTRGKCQLVTFLPSSGCNAGIVLPRAHHAFSLYRYHSLSIFCGCFVSRMFAQWGDVERRPSFSKSTLRRQALRLNCFPLDNCCLMHPVSINYRTVSI